MANMTPRVPVTAKHIDEVVKEFYSKIRVHPTLGPVFNGAIGTNSDIWDLHEEKITRFWRSVLLRDGSYSGSPMATHMEVPDIRDEHFTQWLELFDQVLYSKLPEEDALAFSDIAHQIGRALRQNVCIGNGL